MHEAGLVRGRHCYDPPQVPVAARCTTRWRIRAPAPPRLRTAPQVPHDARRLTRDGLAVIDIALQAGGERFVALQVLQEQEQCANSKQLLGNVALQARVLERNGWEVK